MYHAISTGADGRIAISEALLDRTSVVKMRHSLSGSFVSFTKPRCMTYRTQGSSSDCMLCLCIVANAYMPYLGMSHVPILQSLACVSSAFFKRDFHIAALAVNNNKAPWVINLYGLNSEY